MYITNITLSSKSSYANTASEAIAFPTLGTALAARGAALSRPPVRDTAAFALSLACAAVAATVLYPRVFARPPVTMRLPVFPDAAAEMTPQSPMMISPLVSPPLLPHASTALMTLYPSSTWPNTVCLPFRNGVATVHRKNWLPFVFGPALAIDKIPGPWCGSVKFSSAKVRP